MDIYLLLHIFNIEPLKHYRVTDPRWFTMMQSVPKSRMHFSSQTTLPKKRTQGSIV